MHPHLALAGSASPVNIGSAEEWLAAVKEWADEMLAVGATYDWGDTSIYNYQGALKNKKTCCSLLISHALQKYGLFDEDMRIWASKAEGKLKYGSRVLGANATRERVAQIAEEIHSYDGMSTANADLQPGDIVCYVCHVNVYAGKNEKGVKTWYDAGRWKIGGPNRGGNIKFPTFFREGNNIGTITCVLRLKFNS